MVSLVSHGLPWSPMVSLEAYSLGAYSLGAYSLGAYSLGAYWAARISDLITHSLAQRKIIEDPITQALFRELCFHRGGCRPSGPPAVGAP